MTRINVVPPTELHPKHLVAEYRELPRVFSLVRAAQSRGETPDTIDAPTRYTLGRGHVKFFYSRLVFLADRYAELVSEMIERGYNPQYRDYLLSVHSDLSDVWMNDWAPDDEALALNRQRIKDRSPWAM